MPRRRRSDLSTKMVRTAASASAQLSGTQHALAGRQAAGLDHRRPRRSGRSVGQARGRGRSPVHRRRGGHAPTGHGSPWRRPWTPRAGRRRGWARTWRAPRREAHRRPRPPAVPRARSMTRSTACARARRTRPSTSSVAMATLRTVCPACRRCPARTTPRPPAATAARLQARACSRPPVPTTRTPHRLIWAEDLGEGTPCSSRPGPRAEGVDTGEAGIAVPACASPSRVRAQVVADRRPR